MRYTKRRVRQERNGEARFLTFSCIERRPLLAELDLYEVLAARLVLVHRWRAARLHGWVAMPNHVHLLLTPSLPDWPVARLLSAIKAPVAAIAAERWSDPDRPSRDGHPRLWQRGGGFDRNIVSETEFHEKLEYMHANPVMSGLVREPPDWPWSSARWYAGQRDQGVPIEVW